MSLHSGHALPRLALAGNPSDGYFGWTLAFTFTDFSARATSREPATGTDRIEISSAAATDHFANLAEVAERLRRGEAFENALACAALVTAARHLGGHPFERVRVDWQTSIPRCVGMAGSSAIVIAVMRSLFTMSGQTVGAPLLAELALESELVELGITAGPQDRVCQAIEGLVSMDFAKELEGAPDEHRFRRVDPKGLPQLFVAYRPESARSSAVPHHKLRNRFESGDQAVAAAVDEWRELAREATDAVEAHDAERLGEAMDRNFDLRRELGTADESDIAMVEVARSHGAHVNQAGSGGSVVGIWPVNRIPLTSDLEGLGCKVASVEPGYSDSTTH